MVSALCEQITALKHNPIYPSINSYQQSAAHDTSPVHNFELPSKTTGAHECELFLASYLWFD